MSDFSQLLKTLLPAIPSQREREEDYLAEAQNLADLERRMRELEATGGHAISDARLGLGEW